MNAQPEIPLLAPRLIPLKTISDANLNSVEPVIVWGYFLGQDQWDEVFKLYREYRSL